LSLRIFKTDLFAGIISEPEDEYRENEEEEEENEEAEEEEIVSEEE